MAILVNRTPTPTSVASIDDPYYSETKKVRFCPKVRCRVVEATRYPSGYFYTVSEIDRFRAEADTERRTPQLTVASSTMRLLLKELLLDVAAEKAEESKDDFVASRHDWEPLAQEQSEEGKENILNGRYLADSPFHMKYKSLYDQLANFKDLGGGDADGKQQPFENKLESLSIEF